MKFAIITHVNHIQENNQFFGYAPYIREMNIWFKFVDEVIIVAPAKKGVPTAIDISYNHENIAFKKVPDFNLTSFIKVLDSLFKLPTILWKIFWVMKEADHIHLRCPGNMGLIGCLIQIFFPNKKKTAKYAGNWDPKSKQPWTYKLQMYILNNTFLTRNMQVLVYGEWENQSKNIRSFFTATYSESEKEIVTKNYDQVKEFVFVGNLSEGKNPLYAVNLIKLLFEANENVVLNIYGEGIQRKILEQFIKGNNLEKIVIIKGNQNKEVVKLAYQKSHFVILPSQSEGWPKAIAEGMFWGCVPVSTSVSCVPFMLDHGKRGILLKMNLHKDVRQIQKTLSDESSFLMKSKLSTNWSQNFTTDIFEEEISKLIVT